MARGTAVGFAEAQAGWIAARLKRLPARRPFADGAEVPLFGEPHLIRHRPDRRGTVWCEVGEIHVAGRPEHLPRRLRDWLTAELRHRLVPLVHAKAQRVERPVKRITVRDSGIGIDPLVLPHLFQPFVQADSSISRQFGGTGLGLTICKQLCELLGGAITVRSIVGVGSEFSFTLCGATVPVAPLPTPRLESA